MKKKTRTNVASKKYNYFKVRDRVVIDDYPGHWSWASPFTVKAIDGEMVKLEMVGKLVEIKRLFSYSG